MKTIYLILFRFGSEWDGQSICTIESKALFDFINEKPDEDTNFRDMPIELQKEVLYHFCREEGFSQESLPYLTTSELIEVFSKINTQYVGIPVTIGGYSEFTPF